MHPKIYSAGVRNGEAENHSFSSSICMRFSSPAVIGTYICFIPFLPQPEGVCPFGKRDRFCSGSLALKGTIDKKFSPGIAVNMERSVPGCRGLQGNSKGVRGIRCDHYGFFIRLAIFRDCAYHMRTGLKNFTAGEFLPGHAQFVNKYN